MQPNDTQLLEEAYCQVHEGIIDRFKKGAAELKTAVDNRLGTRFHSQ